MVVRSEYACAENDREIERQGVCKHSSTKPPSHSGTDLQRQAYRTPLPGPAQVAGAGDHNQHMHCDVLHTPIGQWLGATTPTLWTWIRKLSGQAQCTLHTHDGFACLVLSVMPWVCWGCVHSPDLQKPSHITLPYSPASQPLSLTNGTVPCSPPLPHPTPGTPPPPTWDGVHEKCLPTMCSHQRNAQ